MSILERTDKELKDIFGQHVDLDSEEESQEETDKDENLDEESKSELDGGNAEKRPKLELDNSAIVGESNKSETDSKNTEKQADDESSIEVIDLDSGEDSQPRENSPPKGSSFADIIEISDEDSNPNISLDDPMDRSILITPNISASQDLDDYDFNLKMRLAGTYKQYRTTYKAKLSEALEDELARIRLQGKDLIITNGTTTVSLEDSPSSLKLTPGTILTAIEITKQVTQAKEDDITVKLQDGHLRHTKEFVINKHKSILKLKELYAKEFKIESIDKIKLLFDGDLLENDTTPDEADIEDDCVIDVILG